MLNRHLFLKDPATFSIPNDGVAQVDYPQTAEQWAVLRYELENFVCEGQYHEGLRRILTTYLDHLSKNKQPAVWVSGFYGSGKSHFVRMLEHYWRNVTFPDGAEARSLSDLPDDIIKRLDELTEAGKHRSGRWAAAGKLSSGADNLRLDILRIVLRSAGLPTEYAPARLVIWLYQQGLYEKVVANLQAQGVEFYRELRDMYVSPVLAQSLIDAYPPFATNQREARNFIKAQFPARDEISNEEFLQTFASVLELQADRPNSPPCTLLVLDEMQQAIGEDAGRTLEVQNIVEDLSARFGSRLLVIATGQSAIQATPQLSKLQGRFTVRVELSDTDVEHVVRQVVLRKDQTQIGRLTQLLEHASGEIDRHLTGTRIAANRFDKDALIPDYPLLPTRRRFWERVLRAIDTGTAAQLRTQLRMVHEATRAVANRPIGTVVGGDFIYEQQKPAMLQSGVLLGDLAAVIAEMRDGMPEGELRSRLCATIFLIGRLPTSGAAATGLRATADVLADLLVEDLNQGSAPLRQQIPTLLQGLVEDGKLLLVEGEYRLQTRESAEWEREFRERFGRIRGDDTRIAGDRAVVLHQTFAALIKGVRLVHGANKTPRKFDLHFGLEPPPTGGTAVPVWVRDGWTVSEKTVREEAQAAGTESPIIFVFLPRQDSDELTHALAGVGAAQATVTARPSQQTTPEGMEARNAMLTRQQTEQRKLDGLAAGIADKARVHQGGGNEIIADSVEAAIQLALEHALDRLFPDFGLTDVAGWHTVVKHAGQGVPDALNAIGFTGNVEDHPAARLILDFIGGSGEKGAAVRKAFGGAGYGWPQDAIDGLLLALAVARQVEAFHNTQPVTVRAIAQGQIGVIDFRRTGFVITTLQRIQMRKFLQDLEVSVKESEESAAIPRMLQKLIDLGAQAGGTAPLPELPDTSLIESLLAYSGNEQFFHVFEARAALRDRFTQWSARARLRDRRLPRWQLLQSLVAHAESLIVSAQVQPQAVAIAAQRTLLDDPDPTKPLIDNLVDELRKALQDKRAQMVNIRDREVQALDGTTEWQRLPDSDWKRLFEKHQVGPVPELNIGTEEKLLQALNARPLSAWNDAIAALPTRMQRAREEAARLLEPQAVRVIPPSQTLHHATEVDEYLNALRDAILQHIRAGNPVII